MKEKLVKIIIDPSEGYVELSETNKDAPIFAFRGEKPIGMIVY